MTADIMVEVMRLTFYTGMILLLPPLLVALSLGLGIGLLQAVTSIQEQTLSFVPKILGIGAVMVILGPWMLRTLVSFSAELWTRLPEIAAW